MKLYTYDPAPNPARLKMFMAYKGIEIETQQIDMTVLEQHSPAYLAVNPEATVPALVLDDGTVLTAVIAIVQYLELLHPERPLMGETPLEKALVLNWSHHLFTSALAAAGEVFRNGHPAFKDRGLPGTMPIAQIPELAERGKQRLEAAFENMDARLANTPFVAGNFPSFADIDLLASIEFAGWGARMQPAESLRNLAAWRDRATEALQAG